ncbi:contact-dependent growth inhibition system immunity protein [Flagellimonas sp. 2504JD4-2]
MEYLTGSKSLEQLECDYWKEPIEYPSRLVQNCYEFRKIPLRELNVEQLRLLISQNIGLDYLIALGIEKLKTNVLAEGDLYEGDLLVAISKTSNDFWRENVNEFKILKNIVTKNSDTIKTQLGEKKFDKLQNFINHGL